MAGIGTQGAWDIIVLELCVNMVFSTEERFHERTTYMVKTIAESNPDKPVFCITLFPFFADWEVDVSKIEGDPRFGRGTLEHQEVFRASLRKTVAEVALPNVHLIEGKEMLSHIEGLGVDLIHPGDYGHVEMGQYLAGRMGASTLTERS